METEVDTTLSPSDEELKAQSEEQSSEEQQEQPGKKTAEARINELIAETKELEKKLEEANSRITSAPPPPPASSDAAEISPQAKATAEFLKKIGFVQKEDLDKRDSLIQERVSLDLRHDGLERKFDGSNGLPQYDRRKTEEFMRSRGIWGDPEDAYKLMHEAEIADWNIKQAETKKKKVPMVNSGSSAGRDQSQTITRDQIREWMKTPEGMRKYDQNRSKIMELMRKGLL